MVSLAHKFAYENTFINAEAVSAVAMLDLAQMYGIFGTPHTVLNHTHHLRGRLREAQLLEAITGF